MQTQPPGLLIIGAGHAGSELAIAARQAGWPDAITLLGEEPFVPYHRPPLSKAWLAGEADEASLQLRPASAYELARVDLRLGTRAVAIDRAAHTVTLADGTQLPYAKLALCTGGRPRPFVCEGIDPAQPPANLHLLRTRADADALRAGLRVSGHLVVIGGGYVGLEVAASAIKLGLRVTLLEAQPRVLARVAGPEVSRFYEDVHRAAGVDVRTDVSVARVDVTGGRIVAVHTTAGERIEVDAVVAGLGMLVDVGLAAAVGLAQEAGIPIDEHSCTADPDILAAGDCTLQVSALYGGAPRRIESVPNALEQARAAAGWLAGKPRPNRAVPWFWSDQYDLKLQMAGLSQGWDRCVLRGDPAARSFAAFYLAGRRLLAVDAVNRPAEFMLVRRLLAQPVDVDADLTDESRPLKDLLPALTPAGITGKP
ncbi:NAD(P)/FAD-dependent oxidoreductase [Ramlibacter sp.]|uniref:NAD(P)/FAD-dependent oxidoreductase n=1 Tax=Ramlibacter sp. TaxID=1917967 RepID=UPI0035B3BAAC